MRMMDPSIQHNRTISRSHFGPGTTINQGVIYNQPHQPAAPSPARVIPYPRNGEVVHRPDLVDKLDALLPLGQEHDGAALWGLGGSGKTQIALEYAYRRFKPDSCSVFWVHADSEATFANDYKTIAAKLGVDKSLEGKDLYEAVRDAIEAQPSWVLILDNADDLALFGVGSTPNQTDSLDKFLPRGHTGTVLWTSRDGRIAEVVGLPRAIEVARMTAAEAKELLAAARNNAIFLDKENQEVDDLLGELQWLPLAISQAGAYMRRTSTTVKKYMDLLQQSRQRRDVLRANQGDPHRRPGLPNSVLETWAISLDRIRLESQTAHRIMHVLAYIDNQNIPFDVIAVSSGCEEGDVVRVDKAVARLREFSFLGLRETEDGEQSYDMHKLVQEATRYGLSMAKETEGDEQITEAYFAGIALKVITQLFPQSSQETWQECDKYLAHAVRVGDWADMCGNQVHTATLLSEVSYFLYERGRWREKEPVDTRTLGLRREVLGERHPHTIRSMASLATTYHAQGRYGEAEKISVKVLDLRREVLGERHPDTISSMADLAATYHAQGRYDEAEKISVKVLDLRREVLGERHPDTIDSMASLATTYHAQGRYDEAEKISVKVLDLRREVLGERHPDTIYSMASLAATYHAQGRYNEAEKISVKVLDLRREVLGERHPDTLQAMHNLAITWYTLDRHEDALTLMQQCLIWQRRVLGSNHPQVAQSRGCIEKWE